MVQPAVYADAEADARLAALGLTQDVLATALQQADAEAAQTTDLDPPTAEGLVRYIATVRCLRLALVSAGWTYDNGGNYCRTVHPDGAFSLVVSSGDGGTGDPLGYPSTKYPKGESTVRAVASNQLIIDFGVEGIIDDETADDAPTWLLLQRIEADAIYAEVSLPRDSSGGKINGWSERILLQPIPRPDASVLAQIPQEPEPAYDVAVARR